MSGSDWPELQQVSHYVTSYALTHPPLPADDPAVYLRYLGESIMSSLRLPDKGTWIGRVWRSNNLSNSQPGPAVISVTDGKVYDITDVCPTVAGLLAHEDRLSLVRSAKHRRPIYSLETLSRQSLAKPVGGDHLLSPIDLQCIKAAGVTFATSLIERMIEEQAGGDSKKAAALRVHIEAEVGEPFEAIQPGSEEAEALAQELRDKGIWSQYLEVGIGKYAEVFTKAPVLSSVGFGQEVAIHPDSNWNNPEPELVLVVNRTGEIVGATLGNDVNLRDIEGRSALLLGRAKDNNASCAIGPLIRLFDDSFGYEDLSQIVVSLEVTGPDGFSLSADNSVSQISRSFRDLVGHTFGANHQYPDGFVLMTGTAFVPTVDRDQPGEGFTHKVGDVVTVSAPELGALVNSVQHSNRAPPWSFGIGALMENLAQRQLQKGY